MLKKPHNKFLSALCDKETERILFVCLGNICRSPAAEGIMKDVVKKNGDESRWIIPEQATII